MRLALMKNRWTLHRTKTQGRGAGKTSIPRDMVVYTGLSWSLEEEREKERGREGVGGQGGSEEDRSDSEQCWKEREGRGE